MKDALGHGSDARGGKVEHSATFSNGHTLVRNSKRTFSHAYLARTSYLNQVKYGFAASAQLAERAGRANFGPKNFTDVSVEVVPVKHATKSASSPVHPAHK